MHIEATRVGGGPIKFSDFAVKHGLSDTKREILAYLVDNRSCFFEKPEVANASP